MIPTHCKGVLLFALIIILVLPFEYFFVRQEKVLEVLFQDSQQDFCESYIKEIKEYKNQLASCKNKLDKELMNELN